jgi:thiol-disulfide isomerase/thioredoxin
LYFGIAGEGAAGPLVYVPSVLGILFGSFILWILTQPKTPLGEIKIAVGDKVLPFTAKTSQGATFDSAELSGKRVLLKFFRGDWCPYCSAELIAFNEMSAKLEKHGVSIAALLANRHAARAGGHQWRPAAAQVAPRTRAKIRTATGQAYCTNAE